MSFQRTLYRKLSLQVFFIWKSRGNGDSISSYDSYRGVDELMPMAKGVSLKPKVWDDFGKESQLDCERMMKIVVGYKFNGYVGIEHGTPDREWESIEEIRVNLDMIRRTLSNA